MIINAAINNSLLIWLNKVLIKIECFYYAVALAYHRTDEEISREQDIIERCKKNPKYFAPIYMKYHDQLFLFIHKRVDDLDLSADLTSRVFFNCLKHIDRYKSQGVPFSAWLYRIAINEVNSYFRKEKKRSRVVNIDEQHLNELFDEIDHKEPQIDPHVLVPVLLEQLNEKEVELIELRFFEGRTFKEIGYLLGLTEVNAKVKTYRILNKLQKIAGEVKYN